MADPISNLTGRLRNLSSQTAVRQLTLLLGLAASIALGMGLVQWASQPEYVPLYGDMNPAVTTEVLDALDQQGIRHQLNNRSGVISVPADKVHQARLKLASEGLPKGDGAGFDMLYREQEMGVSSFMEKARYDRALEQELSQTIAAVDGVKAARVHLAIPKQSAFVRRASQPAASVLLSLYGGRQLTDNQLAGVVFLVASSVPGMSAEQVSVVDNKGRLLSSQGQQDGMGYTQEQFRYTQQLEQSYVDRIGKILTPILGVAAFRAQVAADLDFTMVERTSESYAPETKVRSEQLVEELSDSPLAKGIPGTLSNDPPRETIVTGQNTGLEQESQGSNRPSRSSKRELRNYELDKTISHIREVPGTLQKLSVAVVIDHREQAAEGGESERVAMPPEQLAEIITLVKEAVGFVEERGDSINVVSAPFVTAPALEAMPEPSILEQQWIWRVGKMVAAAIGFVLLLLFVLRPLMQASAVAAPSAALAAPAGQPALMQGGEAQMMGQQGMVMGDEQVTLSPQQQPGLPAGAPVYQQQLNMARSMVDNEPERVAHVVKNWVAADG